MPNDEFEYIMKMPSPGEIYAYLMKKKSGGKRRVTKRHVTKRRVTKKRSTRRR
jgi:hypothetical protein